MTPTPIDELARRAGQAVRDRADDVDRARPRVEQLWRRHHFVRTVLVGAAVAVLVVAVALVAVRARPATAPIIGEGDVPPAEETEPEGVEETPEALSPEIAITSGTFEGTDRIWTMRAWLTEEGVCIELEGIVCGGLPTGTLPSVEHPLGFVGTSGSSAPDESGCVFGPVHQRVASVEIAFLGGSTMTLTPVDGGELPTDFYGTCWSSHRQPLLVRALDGNEELLASERLLDSADGPPDPDDTWLGPPADHAVSVVSDTVINLLRGPFHCDWQDALLLHVGWPLGTEKTGQDFRQYVRDPHRALPDEAKLADYLADSTLPDAAEFTGYHTRTAELWIDPATADTRIFLVVSDHIEQWPRTDPPLLCE